MVRNASKDKDKIKNKHLALYERKIDFVQLDKLNFSVRKDQQRRI